MKRNKLKLNGIKLFIILVILTPQFLLAQQATKDLKDQSCFFSFIGNTPNFSEKSGLNSLLKSTHSVDIIRICRSGDYLIQNTVDKLFKVGDKWTYEKKAKDTISKRLIQDFSIDKADSLKNPKHMVYTCVNDGSSTLYTNYVYLLMIDGKTKISLVSGVSASKMKYSAEYESYIMDFKHFDEIINKKR